MSDRIVFTVNESGNVRHLMMDRFFRPRLPSTRTVGRASTIEHDAVHDRFMVKLTGEPDPVTQDFLARITGAIHALQAGRKLLPKHPVLMGFYGPDKYIGFATYDDAVDFERWLIPCLDIISKTRYRDLIRGK